LGRATLIIAVSVLLSRVLGIGREMLLAALAGVNEQKNALDLAFLIPDIINHLVSTGFLAITFIPIFTGFLVKNQDDDAWQFFSNILSVLSLFMLLLIIPAWIFMEPLLLAFTSTSPSPEILKLAVHYGRIVLPAQVFFLVGTFFMAVQHIRRRFLIPALTGLIYNASIIIFGWLFRDQGLVGFAWGVPIGAFIGFFVLQIFAGLRAGARFSLSFKPFDLHVVRFYRLTLPLIAGVGAMFALEFVTKSFGSAFGDFGISSLNYAYRMMYTLVAVFGFSVGVASYPNLAQKAKEGKLSEMSSELYGTLEKVICMLLPVLFAVFICSHSIIALLFERGAFEASSTQLISGLLRLYLPASIALCMQVIMVRYFYALEKMWTPTLVNSLVFLASIPVYMLSAQRFGIQSVPIIGAIFSWIQVILLFVFWKKQNTGYSGTGLSKSLLRVLPASAVSLTLALLFFQHPFSITSTSGAIGHLLNILVLGGFIFSLQMILQYFAQSKGTEQILKHLAQKLHLR
jgi:putative peptidoglycan lipid II flippase